MEAYLQFKKSQEEKDHDGGEYVSWDVVYSHFGQNLEKAREFVVKRRLERDGILDCIGFLPASEVVHMYLKK